MNPVFGTAVQNDYLALVRRMVAARRGRLEALRTREDAERYIQQVRTAISRLFPLPLEKTPLNACETGRIDLGNIVLHKVIYHSRPGYPVTAHLYLPKTAKKVPAVLFLCGHSANGKAAELYQICARGLALKGYAVLSVDPVGQGERLQFGDVSGFQGGSCEEHNILGRQLLLVGENMSAWRAWDAIRGLDYLLSRPEVDGTRIGMTGTSGGGTMTTFVNALEDRVTMAAPSCYITTWLHNLENELPTDLEQMPPGALAAGLDMGDFLIARAPRPLAILGQDNDFFDPRGMIETYEEVRRVYRLLGAEPAVRLVIGTGDHGYSHSNRETMYGFFNEMANHSAPSVEPENIGVSPEPEIWCAPGGQVRNLPDNCYARDFIAAKAERLIAARKKHSPQELTVIMRRLLQLDDPFIPHYRVLRIRRDDSGIYSRFGLETGEEGRLMCVLKLKSPRQDFYHLPKSGKIILYIPHLDAQEELDHMEFAGDAVVYGLDVRGVGECTPTGCDQPPERDFFHEYQFDYHYASWGLLCGKPYLGGKVKDILCAVKLLAQDGAAIALQARGQGAVPALIAALLSDQITSLHLMDAPDSWAAMACRPLPGAPLSVMIPQVLAETDLPELREALSEKLR